jgi:hypothetical protein
MPIKTHTTPSLPLVATCVVLGGLLVLWMAQPLLPGWACAASLPAQCPPQVLPFRASLISFVIFFLLLVTISVGLVFQPRSNAWLGTASRWAVIAVPVILVLTALAHFLIPQP